MIGQLSKSKNQGVINIQHQDFGLHSKKFYLNSILSSRFYSNYQIINLLSIKRLYAFQNVLPSQTRQLSSPYYLPIFLLKIIFMRQFDRRIIQNHLQIYINTLNIKYMASQEPLPSSHPQTLNPRNSKVQDQLTNNDSNSITKIRQVLPFEKIINEEIFIQKNHESKENAMKGLESARIFDIRVGLGLNQTTVDTCRKRFSHLLPDYLSARISKSHLNLLNLADKIDTYLKFQKEMRSLQYVFYSQISKNLSQNNNNLQTGVSNLRQILYLDSDFYIYKVQKTKISYDIGLSMNCKYEGKEPRRMVLRKSIFQYLKTKHDQYLKERQLQYEQFQGYWIPSFSVDIKIPMISLPLQQICPAKSSCQNNISDILSQNKPHALSDLELLQRKKSSLKQIINKNKEGQSFKGRLYRMIGEKQQLMKVNQGKKQKLREMKQHLYGLQVAQKSIYMKVVDQINLIYLSKNISNMFYITLIESVVKRTGYCIKSVQKIIEDIILQSAYLEEIKSNNGTIIKIKKAAYREFRIALSQRVFEVNPKQY